MRKSVLKSSQAADLLRKLAFGIQHHMESAEIAALLQDPGYDQPVSEALAMLSEKPEKPIASVLDALPLIDRAWLTTFRQMEKEGLTVAGLQLAATCLELADRRRQAVVSRLAWPKILAILLFLVGVLIVTMVIPTFKDFFEGNGIPLPELTSLVLSTVEWIQFPFIVIVFIWMIHRLARQFGKSPLTLIFKGITDRLQRLPPMREFETVFGGYQLTVMLVQAHALDVPSSYALAMLKNSLSASPILSVAVKAIQDRLTVGHKLSQAIEAEPLLPTATRQALRLIERMPASAQDFCDFAVLMSENEAAEAVERLEHRLILLIYVLLGMMIFSFLIAIYLPIFKIGSAL